MGVDAMHAKKLENYCGPVLTHSTGRFRRLGNQKVIMARVLSTGITAEIPGYSRRSTVTIGTFTETNWFGVFVGKKGSVRGKIFAVSITWQNTNNSQPFIGIYTQGVISSKQIDDFADEFCSTVTRRL